MGAGVQRVQGVVLRNISMSSDNTLTRLSSSKRGAFRLRKKSTLALGNPKENTDPVLNDDDVERRERRRKSFAPDPAIASNTPADPGNQMKSVGLGVCSGLSTAQLAEHYAICIKLSIDNKITVKNAFSLQLIDYMSMMLKRHGKQMKDFQVINACCAIDACTKIYGFRVDAVHSDAIQMVSTIWRTNSNRKKKSGIEDGDSGAGDATDMDHEDDGHSESEVLKRLKKKSRKLKSALAANPESLKRKQHVFQPMDPFLVRLSANLAVSQSEEAPFHLSLKHRVIGDSESEDNCGQESQLSSGVAPLPLLPDLKNLEICPSFRDFTMVRWRPENDPTPIPDLPPTSPPPLNDDHVFDMNQTPEPIAEVDFTGGILPIHKDAKKHTKKEMVINFEYSAQIQNFFQSGKKELTKQTKLSKKTMEGWSSEKLTTPFYNGTIKITRMFTRENNFVEVRDDTPAPEVEDGVGYYQYENSTDQASFCSSVPAHNDDNDDHGADAREGVMHDDGDLFQSQNVHTQIEDQEMEIGAFTGDNLIAPPNKVATVYIPYQMRAKKMNIKLLEGAMWSILANTLGVFELDDFEESNSQKTDNGKIEETFKTLYNTLPQKLPSKVTENLSCPLAFVGLLHLANEKCLDLRSVPDMSDLIIRQGSTL